MRTFIALNLPADVRRAVASALEPMQQRALPVRWVEDDGLHLTLKFLGEIESSSVAPVSDALQQVGAQHAPLELHIAGFGAFPSLRRASVLWVGITSEPRLLALQRAVEDALFSLGYPREQRPFRPHLTAARTRRDAREPDVSRWTDSFDFTATAAVETIDLMRSHTGPGGSRYEPLLKARLGKGAQ
jgi:RNA 2',3'-cyclic 3'-phosphodiesterase